MSIKKHGKLINAWGDGGGASLIKTPMHVVLP